MTTSHLEQADIRAVWDTVRPGLERVKAKINAPWRVEDVYVACVVGTAHLYLGAPGFVVVQPKTDPFTQEQELLVWIAYSEEQDSVSRFQEAVDALALDHGFSKLTMWSNRPGWERNDGWTQIAAVYERHVERHD